MVSPPILSMAQGIPSGPTDLFFLIIANSFQTMLILKAKSLSECVEFISGLSRSQLKTEE